MITEIPSVQPVYLNSEPIQIIKTDKLDGAGIVIKTGNNHYSALLNEYQDNWPNTGNSFLISLDEEGKLLSRTEIGGSGTDYMHEIIQENDSVLLHSGFSRSYGRYSFKGVDYFLASH